MKTLDKLKDLAKKNKLATIGICTVVIVGAVMSDENLTEQPTEAPKAVQVVTVPVADKKPIEQPVVKPEQPKEIGIRSADAKRACNELIKAETTEFSKVDINYLSDSAFLKDASGKATASIGFTIDNGNGVEVPFTGYCYFNVDESLRAFEIQDN